eukprot:scaffold705_cov402-Prasinococcus_capsulatus_cf.AAC.11
MARSSAGGSAAESGRYPVLLLESLPPPGRPDARPARCIAARCGDLRMALGGRLAGKRANRPFSLQY